MRHVEQVAVTATLSLSLSFRAVLLSILNPTTKTMYIRAGGRDVPGSVGASSYICPPASAINLPIVGSDFAFGFGEPSVVAAPYSTSTNAQITFMDAHEQPPVFGSMPLAQVTSLVADTSEVAIYTTPAGRGAGTYHDTITVPSGVRSLLIVAYVGTGNSLQDFSNIGVVGDTSGIQYGASIPATDAAQFISIQPIAYPWFGSLDSTGTLTTVASAANAQLKIFGSYSAYIPSRAVDGSQMVTIQQASGWAGLAVTGPLTNAQLAARLPLAVKQQGTTLATVPLLASAARAGTVTVGTANNPGGYRGVVFYLNVTNMGGGAGIGMRVLLRDPTAGVAFDTDFPVAATCANATGAWGWMAGPGLADRNRTNNIMRSLNLIVPQQLFVFVSPLDAFTYTYSLSMEWIP